MHSKAVRPILIATARLCFCCLQRSCGCCCCWCVRNLDIIKWYKGTALGLLQSVEQQPFDKRAELKTKKKGDPKWSIDTIHTQSTWDLCPCPSLIMTTITEQSTLFHYSVWYTAFWKCSFDICISSSWVEAAAFHSFPSSHPFTLKGRMEENNTQDDDYNLTGWLAECLQPRREERKPLFVHTCVLGMGLLDVDDSSSSSSSISSKLNYMLGRPFVEIFKTTPC